MRGFERFISFPRSWLWARNSIQLVYRCQSPATKCSWEGARKFFAILFETQGLNGIEQGGFARGIETEEDTDHHRKNGGNHNRLRRDRDRPAQGAAQAQRARYPEDHAHGSA